MRTDSIAPSPSVEFLFNMNFEQNTWQDEISVLLYAYDIVLLSESEEGLQNMLNTVHTWCVKWRMGLNQEKTKIIHYYPKNVAQTNFRFKCGPMEINYDTKYKYLGLWLGEHLDLQYKKLQSLPAEHQGQS